MSIPDDIDPEARRIIRIKVKTILGKVRSPSADAQDHEQDLALHAFLAKPKFDPTRASLATFYDRVLTRRALDILRSRKRLRVSTTSLVEEPACPDPRPKREVAREVDAVLAGAESLEQKLAAQIRGGEIKIARAGASVGMTRAQARWRVAMLRSRFTERGVTPC